MNYYAVIGDPIEHSLSPFIHNFLISYYELDGYYLPLKLPENKANIFKDLWQALNLKGANITMPHKKTLQPYIAKFDQEAQLLQNINTIKYQKANQELWGYSTDGLGFIKSLTIKNFSLANKNIIVLGNGGAAQTVVFKAALAEAKNIIIIARDKNKSLKLQQNLLKNRQITTKIIFCDFNNNAIKDKLDHINLVIDLVVNAMPLGMKNFPEDFTSFEFLNYVHANGLIYDLIYNPTITKLLKAAKKCNLKTINGWDMLIWQAFYAFNIFWDIMPGLKEKELLEEKLLKTIK